MGRIINITQGSKKTYEEVKKYMSDNGKVFKEKLIRGWEEKNDAPHCAERELPDMKHLAFKENDDDTLMGEKLGGWPHFVQAAEYSNCKDCGKRMQFVFQIDSEKGIKFMFGDCGIAHIYQCAEHRNRITLTWACS